MCATSDPKKLLRLALAGCVLLAGIVAPQYVGSQSNPASPALGSAIPQDDTGRPLLKHQPQPMVKPDEPLNVDVQPSAVWNELTVAPGLTLPNRGYIWALDNFAAKPQLVQLKYVLTDVDRHAASNQAKVQLAPFIYKPKATVEILGATAVVRLHQTTPAIFVRGRYREDENAADPSEASTIGNLALVKLKVKGERRVVSTVAFTQLSNKAKRSEDVIETVN
jgi:hypothetical protein